MHLLSISALSDDAIAALLARAREFAADREAGRGRLAGRTVFNCFYENSTRTAMSFAQAAARLGAQAITLSVEHSSVKKGETLADTARTLGAMGPDALVLRHRQNGAAEEVAALVDCPVINAGDGTNEHPTQALLDALTLTQHFGDLHGRKIAIIGDIRHSRVARSNAALLPRLGAEVRLAGPPSLIPEDVTALSIDEAIAGADAVMMLRVQRERMDEDLGDAPGEYLTHYGLTAERLALAAPDAVVLHPGPMNRGVEISDEVADLPARSLILRQVANGVATRMAVLEMLVAGL
ncbi:aspartate carbamoyltransferase catalytic subunit [Sphingomonas astaxanthinifaciens]|uniref:Aspartate carbamoyltransferase n=1 Tax=Sphingomonas astaxanthinifaciens DSM 22298 TaxID=1123267 RepID=A0ABQ5Z8L2_9SPHN|nr:aspartate carbamoyltransferase catalytic subunit [Sphingomonas astaxanthinifaciens]GLR46912.1 aspartate carbamoyltransferase [Sphingomonas astaxanthinifaciens DSM 22298]